MKCYLFRRWYHLIPRNTIPISVLLDIIKTYISTLVCMTRFWNNLLQAQDQKIGKPNNLNVPGASNAQNQKIGKPDNLNVPGVSKPNALKLFSMYFCTRNLTKQNTVKDQSFNSLGDYAFSHSGLFFTRNKNHIIYFLDMNNQ
jgi:hypothetical protein